MINIAIITPLKRLENIPYIFSNIRKNIEGKEKYIKIYWYCIFDQTEKEWFDFWKYRLDYLSNEQLTIVSILSPIENAIAGHAHRNVALEEIKKQFKDIWIYNLDDDNLLNNDLFSYLLKNKRKLKRKAGIIFSQQLKDGRIRLGVNRIEVCHVDTAMLLFRLKYLNSLRFIENDYCADGYFIQSFYEQNKKRIYLESTPLCYYNFLK